MSGWSNSNKMTKFEIAMLNAMTTLFDVLYWFALVLYFLHTNNTKGADVELDAMKATIEMWKSHLNRM